MIPSDTAETESEIAEMSSWDQGNRGEKLGLVWRNTKKIRQIFNDHLYLPFFLLIILWEGETEGMNERWQGGRGAA
jgi:hypothetical protein